ncbi:MAG: AIR synthase-related protein [Leptospirales bacterium]|nr:AIR synthase-related protein [Leptospirales bacterium]
MAACSIDTAVRGVLAAGGSLDTLALLDNFCWCDSNNPARLGQLKEAARACYDTAVAYGTPYISGKDSMFNDFSGYDEDGNDIMVSIPPTLLISSISITSDWKNCQSLDFKKEGDLIYLIGVTKDETGGSEYLALMEQSGGNVPDVDVVSFVKNYRAFEKAMPAVASAINLERGGLCVALAKSSIGGLLGCTVDLSRMGTKLRDDILLFSESQGRILCSIAPQNKKEFETCLEGTPFANIGEVTDNGKIKIISGGAPLIDLEVSEAAAAYKGVFAGF